MCCENMVVRSVQNESLCTENQTAKFKFLNNSLFSNMTELRRSQLLLSDEDDAFKSQLHFSGFPGFLGAAVELVAGHRSQFSPMDFGVTTSWFIPPLSSTQ